MNRTNLEKKLYQIVYEERRENRIKKQMIREIRGRYGIISPRELAEFTMPEKFTDLEKDGFLIRSLRDELASLIHQIEEIEEQDMDQSYPIQLLIDQKLLLLDLLAYLQEKA